MPVKIHGKDYTTVDERIVLLNELIEKKQYSLTTSIEHLHFDSEDKGCIIMKARLTIPGLGPDAGPFEGTAEEREASSQINETSYVENCETSAVGRAFKHAHLWAGSDHGESANAMEQAIHQQSSKDAFETVTDKGTKVDEVEDVKELYEKDKTSGSNNKIPNKHPGKCYRCHGMVEAQKGYIENIEKKWEVFHHECDDAELPF